MVTRVSTHHPGCNRVRNGFLEVAKVKLRPKGRVGATCYHVQGSGLLERDQQTVTEWNLSPFYWGKWFCSAGGGL